MDQGNSMLTIWVFFYSLRKCFYEHVIFYDRTQVFLFVRAIDDGILTGNIEL